MKPVDQTTFGLPGGNCFSACVASILELAIDHVPYFMGDADWWDGFSDWIRPLGFYPVMVPLHTSSWRPCGWHILSGRSPRASDEDVGKEQYLHSVVAQADRIVHDPHPSRDGILTHEDTIFLVPINPVTQRVNGVET